MRTAARLEARRDPVAGQVVVHQHAGDSHHRSAAVVDLMMRRFSRFSGVIFFEMQWQPQKLVSDGEGVRGVMR